MRLPVRMRAPLTHLALAGVLAVGLVACSSEEPGRSRTEAEARSKIIAARPAR